MCVFLITGSPVSVLSLMLSDTESTRLPSAGTSDYGGERHGKEDAERLKKRLSSGVEPESLVAGDAYRQNECHEQDFD